VIERPVELRAIPTAPGSIVREDPRHASGVEGLELGARILIVTFRDAGIADEHRELLTQRSCQTLA
jgi:hypothetical protein